MSNLIPLSEAIQMNADYRKKKEGLLAPGVNPAVLPICLTFDNGNISELTSQPGCVSLRAYLSMAAEDNITLVLVGVNDKGEDIISDEANSLIVDNGWRCPTNCPPDSPLNS